MRRLAVVLAVLAVTFRAKGQETPDPPASTDPWCLPEYETLPHDVCHYSPQPAAEAPDTLVIFLHGVVKDGTTWQHNHQRAGARFAKQHGFEVIMPRGRLGTSDKFADHYSWPTGAGAQAAIEAEVIEEWMSARRELEQRNGKPFARIWIFGFSAGAYYSASLALRGRLDVQGYGVFAGGGAPKHVERWARGTHPKPAIYVGWGQKDKARRDPAKLARALRKMGWRFKAVARRGVGHTMTDAQVAEAVAFLRAPPVAKKARPKTALSR